MKLFVKFPFVSLIVLCGFAQAQQYGNYEPIQDADRESEAVREQSPEVVNLPGPMSENGMIVDVVDDKILFYQPASADGKKKETYGSVQVGGEGSQTDLDIKMDEHENGQVNAHHKRIKFDETDGKFDVKLNNVVDGKEQELKRGQFDAETNQFVTETCTNATTSSGDCVLQDDAKQRLDIPVPNFKRTPASTGDEQRIQVNFDDTFPEQ